MKSNVYLRVKTAPDVRHLQAGEVVAPGPSDWLPGRDVTFRNKTSRVLVPSYVYPVELASVIDITPCLVMKSQPSIDFESVLPLAVGPATEKPPPKKSAKEKNVSAKKNSDSQADPDSVYLLESVCEECRGRKEVENPTYANWNAKMAGGLKIRRSLGQLTDELGPEPQPKTQTCPACKGCGTVPTPFGNLLLDFMARRAGNQSETTATIHLRVPDPAEVA